VNDNVQKHIAEKNTADGVTGRSGLVKAL